ncbi:MAG: hypothetical protein IT332_06110 [Ardenticatenales bacterium]|nr:hypothetical protein [Ardenticatenales bacterium]
MPPSPQAEGARSIAAAFRALADVASAAADDAGWQQADDTYNNVVLAALDLHRPSLVQAGDVARGPLATVDGALFQVGQALDGQDAARIRAEAERVAAALDALAPGLAGSAPALGTTLAGWRKLAADFERLAGRQLGGEDVWRDMRNAAIALMDDVAAREAAVAAAVPAGAIALQQVRVMAYRMRMAALDQSPDAAAGALALFDRAMNELETSVSTGGVPPREVPAILSFEGLPVVGQVGQSVAVPIMTRGVADVGGLGGFVLDIRWSTRALRMDDVRWNLGGAASATANDVAAGHYILELPPAPVGPEVDARVAELVMTVLGVTPDPADYVPSEPLAALYDALDEAEQMTLSGEVAMASARLFGAYAGFADGQGVMGSLYARLEAVDRAALVETAWLGLLDRASRPEPAGADAIVEAIGAARAALAGGVEAYVSSLSTDGGIPITIDVISATDLAGRSLATRRTVAARVLTSGLATPTAIGSSNGAAGSGSPAGTSSQDPSGTDAPPAVVQAPPVGTGAGGAPYGSAGAAGGAGASDADAGAGDGRPDGLLRVALAAALLIGGLGALLSARRGSGAR